MLLAQISDLHIRPEGQKLYDFIDTNGLLARHVAYLNNLHERPDAVIISGDITNFGTPAEYRMARKILRQLDYPIYLIPGNHDRNANLLAAFAADFGYLGNNPTAIHYTVENFPIRLVFIDSSVEGKTHGEIGIERLNWLETSLRQEPNRPTAIFTHHHPIPSGCLHMDTIRCRDGADLLGIISAFPQVRYLFCGHTHRAIFQMHGQLLIATAPSSAHQIPYNTTNPNGFFSTETPAMLMHRYSEETGLVSYVATLGHFDGPFRFDCVDSLAESGEMN